MRQLKPLLKETSAPVPHASYVGDFESQTKTYSVFMFKVGNHKVYVATLPNGDVAHNGELPWFWKSEQDAAKQITKWR